MNKKKFVYVVRGEMGVMGVYTQRRYAWEKLVKYLEDQGGKIIKEFNISETKSMLKKTFYAECYVYVCNDGRISCSIDVFCLND